MSFSVGVSGVYKTTVASAIGVSGVWKTIISMHIGSSSAWKLFFAGGLIGSLTGVVYSSAVLIGNVVGFWFSGGKGSISPSRVLADGKLVQLVETRVNDSASIISISGFSSNPGTGYLNFITWNGVTKNGSAATFNYNSGTGFASWEWVGGFGLSSGATHDILIAISP